MTVALTGATGLLGQALLRRILAERVSVRALVRRPADAPRLRDAGVEVVEGDLHRSGDLARLVEPGDVLIHAAALVSGSGPWRTFQRTTVDGTRRLLAEVLPRLPARVVYVSSAAVYAATGDPRGLCTDRTPVRPLPYNNYARAKLAAEDLVRRECDLAGREWTILRLGFLYGPGQRTLLSQVAPLLRRDRLFMIGRGENRIATLFVDDAADAVWRAALSPAARGRIYDVASDEVVTQREFLDGLADAVGLPHTRRRVRPRIVMAIGWLADMAAQLPGLHPPLSRALVALMSADQVIDSSRIRDELGWSPRVSFGEGVARTWGWVSGGGAG